MDDQRNRDRHTPERRHDIPRERTLLGCATGMSVALIVLFLLCSLVLSLVYP